MNKPETPDGELERLNALLQTELLGSKPEQRFDRITKLAQVIFDVPIALISLLDSQCQRQWFKSRQGLSAAQTNRSISFCNHAILDADIFEVPDASKDDRFFDNPLVTDEPFIRFYAGAPLYTDNGYAIGTLCIIDKTPRSLTSDELSLLRLLGDMVESEITQVERNNEHKKRNSLQQFSEVIVKAQSNFIGQTDRIQAFDILLDDILALTGSEYGFIGDVLFTSDNQPYLKAYSMTDIAWNEETKKLYAQSATNGLEFKNLDSLIGAALKTGEPVIANNPGNDPRAGGLPDGHPALHYFLGVPIHCAGKLVAMIGLANKEGGYGQELVTTLRPLLLAVGQIVEASRRHLQLEKQRVKLSYLSAVASQTTNAVIITDVAGKVEWVNEGFCRLTGYTPEEARAAKPGELLHGPETDPATVEVMEKALSRCESFEVDIVNYSKAGKPYWIRVYCNPLKAEDGATRGYIAIQSNIDQQKRNENELKESAQFQSTILNTIVEGLITTDQDGIIQMCNPSIEAMFGYCQKSLLGKNIKMLMPENYADVHDLYLSDYKVKPSTWHEDIIGKARALTAKRRNGDIFPIEIEVKKTFHNGDVLFVASIRDISTLKQQEDEIEKLAYFDPLTNLANRRLLKARINAISEASKNKNYYHSLLFIDIDHFKKVNDSLGHTVGDNLLVELGRRIHSCVISYSDTAARLGGDEFCVLLTSLGTSHDEAKEKVRQIANRILREIERPLIVQNARFTVSASIGISFFCGGETNFDTSIKQADMAMHEAKEQGKNQLYFFNTELGARLLERIDLESNLRTAINEETLTVHYQPVVDKHSRIVKLEALARWHHPKKGWIRPDIFIPIAEAYQLIVPLGNLVLKLVLRDLRRWLSQHPDLNWKVAVNISQFQLSYEHFQSETEALFNDVNIAPDQIVFEVTETSVARDIAQSITQMADLKTLGVTFSLDDFGTGYSSLAYLKQLPISELKIDKSFVAGLPHDLDNTAIVNSVIFLAKAMNLNVVAEGVETLEQWQYLKNLDCEIFQGYYFSRPLPASDIENLITTEKYKRLID
ncbi:MAG: EAL domain-containing protein [Pseudomonadota bacterium]